MISVLRENPGFCRLWLAQTVLAGGDACFRMGLLEVFRAGGLNQDVETAKMFFALSVPGLLLGPFVMAYVDRWQRRWVLMVGDGIRVGLMVVMLACLWGRLQPGGVVDALPGVYALILLSGMIATFYLPTRYALLPRLVPAGKLVQANTLLTTSLAVLAVGGMPLGGWIAFRFGPLWGVGLNGLAYLMSVVLVQGIVEPTSAPPAVTRVRDELRDGIRYLWGHPTVVPLVLIAGAFAFLAGILIVTIIGYAQQTLRLTTLGLGWLGGAAGVGGAVGVALVGRGRPWTRSIWLPPLQLVVGGAGMWLLSWTANPWAATPLLMLIGAVAATAAIPIDVKLQEQVEEARRGAVFAARGMLTSATMIVAFWMKFGTNLLRTTPPPRVLMWCGAGAVVVAVLTALALRRRQATPG